MGNTQIIKYYGYLRDFKTNQAVLFMLFGGWFF